MGNVARMGDKRNTYRVLVGGHLKEREQLGDLEVNERDIKMYIEERGWEDADWTYLAQAGTIDCLLLTR